MTKTAQLTVNKSAKTVAKELISALAVLNGWTVMLVVLIIVVIIAPIEEIMFGIFISEEATETATRLSQRMGKYE